MCKSVSARKTKTAVHLPKRDTRKSNLIKLGFHSLKIFSVQREKKKELIMHCKLKGNMPHKRKLLTVQISSRIGFKHINSKPRQLASIKN